ncbi:hypothetical protein [Variovorax sp. CF079]|uniref:hypothetical protein n=1 Tax=Variovorax sp. CF079 TaxID=1882774 RepID=UPI00147AEC10|nr:hypothetical protein [Variovorax sp. CF079]
MESALSLPSHRLALDKPLAAGDILAIFAAARRLQAHAHAGTIGKPLHGKNIALLLGRSPSGETSALHRAALELGARVAEVPFAEPAGVSGRDDIRGLARMLRRMYDAIDCGTLAAVTVRQIEQEAAGVPVYAGLALEDHLVQVLADLMTLCDHRPPSASKASKPSILYLGDPRTKRGRAFLAAARQIGFEVRLGQRLQAASNDATIFVVDATHHPRWALHSPSSMLDEARRSETHRRVMQAVLLDTIERV